MERCTHVAGERNQLHKQQGELGPVHSSTQISVAREIPFSLSFKPAGNKSAFVVAVLIAGSALAAPPPVKTNPETERLVKERVVKYERGCARTTGPADLYSCHQKHWDGLASDIQAYAFQIQRSKSQTNPQWYEEFESRYIRGADYRNCTFRFGQYNPMAALEITACHLREYAFLEVMVEQHNKGIWKPSVATNAASSDAQRKKADAVFRGIKETNSEKYEGD